MMMTSDVLIIGRDKETCILEDSYKKCMNRAEIVWIYGASGVGKSALIQNFLHNKQNVCNGKFDFAKSSAPYSVIIKVLNELCPLLEAEHSLVRIGPDVVSILSTLLPNIHKVITTTCKIDEDKNFELIECHERKKSSEWGFEKLKQAMFTFVHESVAVISSESIHPLILYLDDLQWADEASLDLMKSILNDSNGIGGFMFIGSYRENEVANEDCQFAQFQRKIQENSYYTCTKIPLENLTLDDVTNLLSNIRQMPRSQLKRIGRLVYAVTRGNSFFVWCYIRHIMERNWMLRNDDKDGWIYEENTNNQIDMNSGEDVLLFLMEEISNLQPVASEALQVASILGPEVDISILELILSKILTLDMSNESITAILEYLESKLLIILNKDRTLFHFQHDRIYQAAFQLVSQEYNLEQISLRIGRIILGIDNRSQGSTSRFHHLLAVDQLNRGRVLIDTTDGKEELAKLNLKAAQEVLQMSAFKLAQNYLEVSLELLGGDSWETHYALTLKISNVLASVLSGNGLMSQSLLLIDEINEHCKSSEDRRDTQIIKLYILAGTNQLDRCLEESQKMLTELRCPKIPLNPGLMQIFPAILGVKRILKRQSVDDILGMPLCNDKRVQHVMKILGILCPVAFFASKESMIPVITCRMMTLSLKYGLTDLSPYAFSSFGFCMTATGDFQEAFRFRGVALQLMGRFGEDAKTLVMVYGLFYHTQRHLADTFKPTLRAYYVSFIQGDLAFSGQAICMHLCARMVAGSSLEHIISDTFCFADQLKTYNQYMMWNFLLITQRCNLELADRSEEIVKLIGLVPDGESFLLYLKGERANIHDYYYYILTLYSHFMVGDKKSALILARKCWRLNCLQGAFHYSVIHFFYSSLVAMECWREERGKISSSQKGWRYWRIFRKFQRILLSWTEKGDPNTVHLAALLKAEVLTTKQNVTMESIQEAYHQSINPARRSGFLHNAALGNELLGQHCHRLGDCDLARDYLEQAKILYFDWGAFKKVQAMELAYGNLVCNQVSKDLLSTAVSGRSRQGIVYEIETLRAQTHLSMDVDILSNASD